LLIILFLVLAFCVFSVATLILKNNTLFKEIERARSNIDFLTNQIEATENFLAKTTASHLAENQRLYERNNELREQHERDLIAARADAVKKSKAVVNGFSWENFAPLLGAWPQGDFRHLGDPIDYLVCAGASAVNNGDQDLIDEIVLLDVKTGKASLNKTQIRIRNAIIAGRVAFAVFNPETGVIKEWRPGAKKATERMNEQPTTSQPEQQSEDDS